MKKNINKGRYFAAIAGGSVLLLPFFLLQAFSPTAAQEIVSKYSNDYYSGGDTLLFSGYKWVTKESNERHTGPGRNYFAGGRENIWVDDQGRMHIRTTHRNGRWYCAEARLAESLGYGKYIFHMEPNPAKLDKDLVVGFFTYDHEVPLHHHREIDIEFSTWGNEKNLNSQYVLQPFEVAENVHRYQTDLTRATRHEIGWKKGCIDFSSSYVSVRNDSVQLEEYASWFYKPHPKLTKNQEKFSMNVWIFKADFPSDFNDYEFIVSKFEFVPYKFHQRF